jgi:hypothetical protein
LVIGGGTLHVCAHGLSFFFIKKIRKKEKTGEKKKETLRMPY